MLLIDIITIFNLCVILFKMDVWVVGKIFWRDFLHGWEIICSFVADMKKCNEMKKRAFIFGGMVVLLIGLAGCRGGYNSEQLERAEACMETRPDSAQWHLQQLDEDELSDEQRARYALLWTQAMHKCRQPIADDSLIRVAVEYYQQTDDRHRQAKAWLYKGLVHKGLHQVKPAAEAFVASERAFERVEDDQYKALLYNHYGALLFDQFLFDEALEYFKKSYSHKLKGDSIHYILSSCSRIATIYEVKEMPDSAEAYYERGLSLLGQCRGKKSVGVFLQNYAGFLTTKGRYAEAERMLKECEQTADSFSLYKVYASLSTLYYETKQYELALDYSERVLASGDSLMQWGSYQKLSQIHRKMGNVDEALRYHNIYRHYDSDLTLRRQTAQVAVVPHKQANRQLEEENREAHHHQIGLWLGIVAVVCVAVYVMRRLNRKHGEQLEAMDSQLEEMDTKLEKRGMKLQEVEQNLVRMKVSLGGLKGVVSRQTKAIEGLKQEQQEMKQEHSQAVRELKGRIEGLETAGKHDRKAARDEKRALMQQADALMADLKKKEKDVAALAKETAFYEHIQQFLMDGGNLRAASLLMELKSGQKNPRIHSKPEEYAELLTQLAEHRCPGIRKKIEADDTLRERCVLLCLMLLGMDDMATLCRITGLRPNSVRTYMNEMIKLRVKNEE